MESRSSQAHSNDLQGNVSSSNDQVKSRRKRKIQHLDPLPETYTTQSQECAFKVPMPNSKPSGRYSKRLLRASNAQKECSSEAAIKNQNDVREYYSTPHCNAVKTKHPDNKRATARDEGKAYLEEIPLRKAKTKAQLKGNDDCTNRPGSTRTKHVIDDQLPGPSNDNQSKPTERTALEQLPGSASTSPFHTKSTRHRRCRRILLSPENSCEDKRKAPRKRKFPFSPNESYNRERNEHATAEVALSPERAGRTNPIPSSLSSVNIPEVSRHSITLNKLADGSPRKLGEGEFGYVVRGKLKENGQLRDIVAKYFKPSLTSNEEIVTEARILHLLEDTGVVPKVYGLMEDGRKTDRHVLIQECVAGGQTLFDLLFKEKISRNFWVHSCLQVAKGLEQIHNKGVLLNDIKEDNILIDYQASRPPKVRIIDMGIATFNDSFVTMGNLNGCYHIAPEVKRHKPTSIKSDIFSLGYVVGTIGKRAGITDLEHLGKLLMATTPSKRPCLPDIISRLTSLHNSN